MNEKNPAWNENTLHILVYYTLGSEYVCLSLPVIFFLHDCTTQMQLNKTMADSLNKKTIQTNSHMFQYRIAMIEIK